MLLDILKGDIISAMRRGDNVAKDVLRLVVGEAQTLAANTNKAVTDEQVHKLIQKMIQSNTETLQYANGERKSDLEKENQLLQSYLPKQLTRDEIKNRLLSIENEIKGAKADGQAVGFAMKFLKESGDAVDGNEVKAVVAEIRTLAQS